MSLDETTKKRMILSITQDVIDRSHRSSASKCPLANAGREATGKECLCDGRWLTVVNPNGPCAYQEIPLSPEALALVQAWDSGKPVEPCTIELTEE